MSAQAMLRQVTGLNISKAQADRAIRQRMEHTGSVNRDHYLSAMSPEELTALVELVVVPESWLFREPQAFTTAVEIVQARLAHSPRLVHILSVPCAGGEEPYSIAMALFDAGVTPPSFSIDAYDISPGCVKRARAGVYGRNAFRTQDLAFRERYFTQQPNDDYRISDAIKAQVRISQGNLLELNNSIPPRHYDLVFCRNLLIYFDKATTAQAIRLLSGLLADDGILFAGYAEVPSFTQHGFATLPHRQAFALKKRPAPPSAATAAGAGKPAAGKPVTSPVAVPAQPARPRAVQRQLRSPTTADRAPAAAPATTPPRAPVPAAAAALTPKLAKRLADARVLADRGAGKDAVTACLEVVAAMPHTPEAAEAYFLLGMLSEQGQKPAEAEQYWRRCIYLQPNHYEALCHLALLAEQQGNQDGAAALKARAKRLYLRMQQDPQAGATKAER